MYSLHEINYLARQSPSNKHKGYTRVQRPPSVVPPPTEQVPVIPEMPQTVPPPAPALPIRYDYIVVLYSVDQYIQITFNWAHAFQLQILMS